VGSTLSHHNKLYFISLAVAHSHLSFEIPHYFFDKTYGTSEEFSHQRCGKDGAEGRRDNVKMIDSVQRFMDRS